jgi:superfamily I DNA/RNA helicase
MTLNDGDFSATSHSYPVRDEITGEIVSDPDGFPIAELESADYLDLASSMSVEERAAGERAWRFGHVIVDEAQDLTQMQWRMIGRRARGYSMTIVGDLAQRTNGTRGSWSDILPAEFGSVNRFDLSTNYRSPGEVAPYAAAVLHTIDAGLSLPESIRDSGHPVRLINLADQGITSPTSIASASEDVALDLVDQVDDGRVALIGCSPPAVDHPRIRSLAPASSKGMEFDAVILIEPAEIVEQPHGLGLLYVALTRTTDHLVIVHQRPLPELLAGVAEIEAI